MLIHIDYLIPPLEIRFERFEENELDNATISPEVTSVQEDEELVLSEIDNLLQKSLTRYK